MPLVHTATLTTPCSGQPWLATDAGFEVQYDNGLPPNLNLPAALRVELIRDTGPPELVQDNRAAIAAALGPVDHGRARPAAASTAGSPTATAAAAPSASGACTPTSPCCCSVRCRPRRALAPPAAELTRTFLAPSLVMGMALKDKVVVITGASSGIGRAAARLFAERGARLVLAARRADELGHVAAACATAGARAVVMPTDVTDAAAVEALAARALAEFGAIDVWCNNAGVYAIGELGDVPLAVHHRLIEVNLVGLLHGMRAALAQMRTQGHGTIINTTSMAGKAPYALAATYCATKAAARALTEAVRQEEENDAIHICAVSPPSVDTPLYQHAANYTGRVVKPPRPIYSAERAARAIVRCAERPRREASVGMMPLVAAALRTLVRPLWDRLAPATMRRQHLGKMPAADAPGNLFAPRGPGGESGGWKKLGERAATPSLAPRTLEAG